MRKIPQANDLNKVLKLLEAVSGGSSNYLDVAEYMDFDKRQSAYYAEAAEMLSLVNLGKGKYEITQTGKMIVNSTEMTREVLLVGKILDIKIFDLVFRRILENGSITKDEIVSLIMEISVLNLVTADRRYSTIISWLKWISDQLNVLTFKNGIIELNEDNRAVLENLLF